MQRGPAKNWRRCKKVDELEGEENTRGQEIMKGFWEKWSAPMGPKDIVQGMCYHVMAFNAQNKSFERAWNHPEEGVVYIACDFAEPS